MAKIAFTGSAATARKVMAASAENLTPLMAECGGKDALLVSADADLDAAADAAAWGAMSNAGQTCVGIERVYVVDDGVPLASWRSWPSGWPGCARGRPRGVLRADDHAAQPEIVAEHIADALARGGRRGDRRMDAVAGALRAAR